MSQRSLAAVVVAACALAAAGALVAGSPVGAGAAPARAAAQHLRATSPSGCARTPRPGHVTCFAELGPAISARAVARAARPSAPPLLGRLRSKADQYTPADLASLYRIPSHRSPAATIGLVEVGHDPDTVDELAYYRALFGLPACTRHDGCFEELAQDGTRRLPGDHRRWDTEIALDVQAVSAICPTCHILLVDSRDTTMRHTMVAAATAVKHGARYVSMSFGAPEDASTGALARFYLSDPDVTYVAATGDDGYTGAALNPAAAANVIAAGGTSVRLVDGVWRQRAWSGSGGACARLETQSVAQALAAPARSACGRHRAVSDVSALADVDTGMLSYVDGRWYDVGGTSLATPIIAALYAVAGNHADPMSIYRTARKSPGSFVDVTSGATGSCTPAIVCTAAAGWDGPTGLGTPASPAALAAAKARRFGYAAATAAGLRVVARSPLTLRCALRDAVTGTPVRGAAVTLQRRSGRRWRPVTRRRTDAQGTVTFTRRPRRAVAYRVVFRGEATWQPSTSRAVHLAPHRGAPWSTRVEADP